MFSLFNIKISRTLCKYKNQNSEIEGLLMEQITLLLVMDKEMKKRLQQQEGSSLFSEIRNTRHVSNIKFKQIEKALQYVLD